MERPHPYYRPRRLALMYLYLKYLDQERKPKRWWVRLIYKNRTNQGDSHNLLEEMRLQDVDGYFNYLRMTPAVFDELLNYVGPMLLKQSVTREVIEPGQRLSLTIRHLANGDSLSALAFSYRLGKTTVSNIIKKTTEAIWTALKSKVFMDFSEENWLKVAMDFQEKWNFPNCLGAIDGKHVAIQAPPNCGSEFFNYKGTHSIVLMALCDANYLFTMVDIGASGRQSDGGVFKNTTFYHRLCEKTLNIPSERLLPSSASKVPLVMIGDEAIPLTNFLMRPYPGRNTNELLSPRFRVFNYRLGRARRMIENMFGIMVARWRLLRRDLNCLLSTAEGIVKAITCLHNYLQIKSNSERPIDRKYCPVQYVDVEDLNTGSIRQGDWRIDTSLDVLRPVGRTSSNMYSQNATQIREVLTEYFFSPEGSVPWQWAICNINMNEL